MKRINDLSAYTSVLPYASELFGIYQPLIGWRSGRQKDRVERGFKTDLAKARRALLDRFVPDIELHPVGQGHMVEIGRLGIGAMRPWRRRSTGTFIGDLIAAQLPEPPELDEAAWQIIDRGRLVAWLDSEVRDAVMKWQRDAQGQTERGAPDVASQAAAQLARESAMAGLLLQMKEARQHDQLRDMFFVHDNELEKLQALTSFDDPLDHFDPTTEIDRAALSPIGIVHLFRQYFFELDTFLGTPVSHVWLSPGSMVELVEVTTRRQMVERSLEQSLQSTVRTERSTTTEDEISDAVKQENRSDTKFGMNSTVKQGWITGSATATASLNLDTTQSTAREHTHRQMRQQTEKLSTEIRRSVTSTFRTVTETTDMSSKRYVLNNSTSSLVNYELRRKMRQVAVQVHDVGTYLCWQTYVDDPGRSLGIGKLVHLATDPETGAIPPPEAVPGPGDHTTEVTIDIPFVPRTEDTEPDEDMDEAYRDGVEVNADTNEGDLEAIQWQFGGLRASCGLAGYDYSSIEFDVGGQDVRLEAVDIDTATAGEVGFGIQVRHINFHNNPTVRVVAKVRWKPGSALVAQIDAKNQEAVAKFNEATQREFEKAFVESARDRINKAGQVDARPFEDLREEERIVVYRALIQDMLTKGIPMPDDRTRHVVAELLNTIFDIDKMLYFVAPEWWRPRLHRSHQSLGAPKPPTVSAKKTSPASVHAAWHTSVASSKITGLNVKRLSAREDTTIPASSAVSWGGVAENRVDNYYITEDSEPAPLGASLGWLLQLDGDPMRNAFLNAPWVKAVIPIRPGQEAAAINWLRHTKVEGADGLDQLYVAGDDELAEIPHHGPAPTVLDAIHHLCAKVAAKHRTSNTVGTYPPAELDDANKVSATPVDKVFEHGFYPLEGGFRVDPKGAQFEVFDQWVEILPTDQVVPVEVKYDPKTGRQL